ncbi:anti sigma factor C-terminal domain-containing protein [Bacillus sp. Au-Bac7]|uniref:anti sigma factor C-terminal domain-containing protein n=1 Tax=Bacillus sp. Au-Bac7 TaxID=2906458 RepID=UPI001E416591|nr:anti sigma factor C-terminal domain-containing protein [Bacillus sp. Au-Bac7]MCE4049378.1 anti-sigma factor C-terminal domain-containing protein [Bacillus sp. Au-Bac7]
MTLTKLSISKNRQLLIGGIALCIIIGCIYTAAILNLKRQVEQENMVLNEVKGANTEWKSNGKEYHLLSAVAYFQMEKKVGNQIILSGSMEQKVNILGSEELISSAEMKVEGEESNELLFFDPKVEYATLPQELNKAVTEDTNTLMEAAISFDKPYSLTELEDILGTKHVNWLWVELDSAVDKKLKEEEGQSEDYTTYVEGHSAIGFPVNGPGFEIKGQLFLNKLAKQMQEETYRKEAQLILTALNKTSAPSVTDIKARGTVVSGTPEQLQTLAKLKIIRASTIGAKITQQKEYQAL